MIRAIRTLAALALFALPALAQGPVVLMGIDAEDNNPPQHGGTGPYIDVIGNGILPNIGNGGSGILVIGGGKDIIPPTDDVTTFWNLVGAGLGESVTFVNGAAAISSQSFAGFAVVAIASSVHETPMGGLTNAESNALNGRSADIANHVNGGGGLFGTSQDELPVPYGYLGALGSFTFAFPPNFAQVTPTAEGLAVGITATNLDVSAWHDEYLTFPGFLDVLATNDATGHPCAIGGAQVIIVQGIVLTPLIGLNPIGTDHTVTATVADNFGNPVVGTIVTFTVTAGPHIGTTFMDVTDANGQAFFTYTGTIVGIDTIQGCFTDDNAMVQCAEVTKEWFCTPCVLTCPPDADLDCSDSTDPASTGTPTGCANATFSDSVSAGACAGSYVITRTWSAPDGCGGTASCDQTITVTDTSAPAITCPPDIAIDCTTPTDPGSTGNASASDDCSGVASLTFGDSTAAGNCAGNYVITRTWTAVDGCGNSASCDQTITVSDMTGPVVICPSDVGVDCSASTDPADTGTATAGDACSGVVSVTFSDAVAAGNCAGSFVITRTWAAVDGCGNASACDQTITVSDTTGPVITCPGDVALDCSASIDPTDTGTAMATDDCSGVASVSSSDSIAAGNCPGNYVITRTWTAVDGCGNASSCDQTLTLTDTTAPVIACPPDVGIDCGASTDPADVGMATAMDDCSGVSSLTFSDSTAAGNCAGNFILTRTWTAVDACGNTSSCEQRIEATDTTAPTITCPPDVTVTGCCVMAGIGTASATDDCGSVTIMSDAPQTFCLGDTVVTWTATDDCGNASTCQQLVTVLDITLDFETDGGGGALLHGQSLVTVGPETPYSCPSISSGPDPFSPGNGNNGAAIFDSTSGPFGQDPDLNVGLGNVLYLQANGGQVNNFTGLNGPDTWDHPNDDEDGGTLTFDFCFAVKALSLDLVDIDPTSPEQDSSVTLTDGNGLTRTYSVPGGWTANGPGAAAVGTLFLDQLGVQPGVTANATQLTQPGFDENGVVRIQVRLGSSGAIDNLHYCPSGPQASVTARNGSGLNPDVLTAASMPVVGAQWSANLDCSGFGEGLAILTVRSARATGTLSPFGEVLIGGEVLFRVVRPYSESPRQLSWGIPFDLSLCGLEAHVQGLCQESGAGPSSGKVRFHRGSLSNALDLVLGF